ncbi:hypothetical protein V5799_018087 [Amblyomma americanum]|uniref:Secreted protein n=1 Tax=Amblyomma americanum TaxID=6943 RepID=A0AAQ4F1E2_AMBAM
MACAPIVLVLALLTVPYRACASTVPSDAVTTQGATTLAVATTPAPVASTAQSSDTSTSSGGVPSDGSCIEANIPDVLGLSECLGNRLNLCTDSNTAGDGIKTLINCTAVGIFKNLSPMNALKIMQTFFVAFVHKISPFLGRALERFIDSLPFETNSVTGTVCRGTIKLGFPNSRGKCLDNTLKLCDNGTVVDTSFVRSLVSYNVCMLEDWMNSTPLDNIKQFACNILRGTKALFNGVFFIGPGLYNLLTSATCS